MFVSARRQVARGGRAVARHYIYVLRTVKDKVFAI